MTSKSAVYFLVVALAMISGAVYCLRAFPGAATVEERIRRANAGATHPFWFGGGRERWDPACFIAHGGGAIDGHKYTNSLEAVTKSLDNGFVFIELDLLETSDGHFLAAHDWALFNKATGHPKMGNTAPTLREAKSRKLYGKYTPLDAGAIRALFEENPGAFLVTDKTDAYTRLTASFPFKERLLVEAYSVENYVRALETGIVHAVFNAGTPDNLAEARRLGIRLISMPVWLAEANIETVRAMHKGGVAIFAYGPANSGPSADTEEFFQAYLGTAFSKYYSDFWIPASDREQKPPPAR